jgi:hypothetical protein
MVTKMKKTKCMGTSKNKRAMSGGSGGKGRVSRYTQKFKKCYSSFINIPESDADEVKNDNTKIKKIQEWGRLRGIYTYLKSRKLEEDDKTFLEKMKDNLGEDSYGKYTTAISCLENDSAILLEHGCVLEKDYVNSKESKSIATVESKKADDDEEKKKVEEERLSAAAKAESAAAEAESAAAEAQSAAAEAERAAAVVSNDNDESGPSEPPAPAAPESDAALQNKTNDTAADTTNEDTRGTSSEVSGTSSKVSDTSREVSGDAIDVSTPVGDALPNQVGDALPNKVGDDVPNKVGDALGIDSGNADEGTNDGQGGGRSKRKTKSSRRRGKSMKSKKGRRTRRR